MCLCSGFGVEEILISLTKECVDYRTEYIATRLDTGGIKYWGFVLIFFGHPTGLREVGVNTDMEANASGYFDAEKNRMRWAYPMAATNPDPHLTQGIYIIPQVQPRASSQEFGITVSLPAGGGGRGESHRYGPSLLKPLDLCLSAS